MTTICYYRAMGFEVDATSWERRRSGQFCTDVVFGFFFYFFCFGYSVAERSLHELHYRNA